MSALRAIRVVELAETPAGEYAAKLLSDFGAEVIKIERPGGSPTRTMSPIVAPEAGPEGSGLFAYLNTNKKSVVVDLDDPSQLDLVHRIIDSAAIVIDDHDAEWLKRMRLDREDAERDHPTAVICSITPFGLQAPPSWSNARSLNVYHASGWGYHTPSSADPSRPPLKGAGRFTADYEAGLDAALAALSAYYWRNRSGLGQFIEISQQGALLVRADSTVARLLAGDDPVSNSRDAYDMRGPAASYRCADGFVYLFVVNGRHWQGLRELIGDPEWMREFSDDWLEFGVTEERVAVFRERFSDWILDKQKGPICAQAQRLGIPLVPTNDAADLHASEQFAHRGFFQPATHPVLGEALYPTVPYKLSASPAKIEAAAPLLGQHMALLEALAGMQAVDERQQPIEGMAR